MDPAISDKLVALQSPVDAESLWNEFSDLLQKAFKPLNDILFASPMLGFHPVFARTLSRYPRGEGYWARLVDVAGATDVMTRSPGLAVARMSDHFDRSRERDERLYREFMEPEGWEHCANVFFWDASGTPLGTLAMNRTSGQGDFSDGEMSRLHSLQPHLQAAMDRVIRLCRKEVVQAALGQSLDALPVPIVTLDARLQLAFANTPGREALHQWQTGRKGSRIWKNRNRLPSDLAETCRQLLQAWCRKIRDDSYRGEEISAEREHPQDPGFTAVLRIVQPLNASTEPGFILTFRNPAVSHHATVRALELIGNLTHGEREVARLAAGGYHNEDIASELGISIHTVRAHLRKVFSKLEIDSRSRLSPLFQSLS